MVSKNSGGRAFAAALVSASVLALWAGAAQAGQWDGWYLGGDVGYNWTSHAGVHEGTPQYNGPPPVNYHADGGMVALHGGYNWMIADDWLMGFEGQLGGTNVHGSGQYGPYVGVRLPTDSRASLDESLFANITAHLGVLITPDTLLYAKGGWASADRDFRFIDQDPTGTTLVSGTEKRSWVSGWTVGGGVEFANTGILPAPWTIRLEYDYSGYNKVGMVATSAGATNYPFTHRANENSVNVGVTYHF